MNKKKFIWVFAVIIMASVGTAAWLMSIEGSTIATVTAASNASMSITIPAINLDTTEGANSTKVYSSNFVVNKDILLNVTINETFVDLSNGSCSGGESDCSLVYEIANDSFTYIPFSNGSSVYLLAMEQGRNITVEMSCDAYSCPQERYIDILLTQAN